MRSQIILLAKTGLFLFAATTLSTCALFGSRNKEIRVLHYNIFELDSPKIQGGEGAQQLAALQKFLAPHLKSSQPHLISFNEVQFDRPQVPNATYMTYGQNIQLFMAKLLDQKEAKDWQVSFTEANTGAKAKKYKGDYLTSRSKFPKNTRRYADPVNYGLFPGQYSSALASRFPITQKLEVKNLKWKEFNKKVPLSRYRDSNGKKLPPDMELFDKSFNDTIINIDGHPVHVITLHTVPSYHFGNKKSPNYQRNADQLRFLEWYITGKTDIKVKLPSAFSHIQPLPKDATYIAMGDWNTDLTNLKNPGSKVLKRLADLGRLFPTDGATHEGGGYGPKRRTMLLDYLFHSNDLFLKEAHVLRPKEKRLFLGCGAKSLTQKEEPGRRWVTFKEKGKTCHVTVNENFYFAKESSDHFPIAATFELRRK